MAPRNILVTPLTVSVNEPFVLVTRILFVWQENRDMLIKRDCELFFFSFAVFNCDSRTLFTSPGKTVLMRFRYLTETGKIENITYVYIFIDGHIVKICLFVGVNNLQK